MKFYEIRQLITAISTAVSSVSPEAKLEAKTTMVKAGMVLPTILNSSFQHRVSVKQIIHYKYLYPLKRAEIEPKNINLN